MMHGREKSDSAIVAGKLTNKDTAARMFYDRLFEIDATTRLLFKTTNLAEQRRKLIQALTVVVQGLDHLEALVPALSDLGRRHAQYGVTANHYDTVGAALLWTLERGLGSGWTPEVKAAWSDAYALLADVMQAKALGIEVPPMLLARADEVIE